MYWLTYICIKRRDKVNLRKPPLRTHTIMDIRGFARSVNKGPNDFFYNFSHVLSTLLSQYQCWNSSIRDELIQMLCYNCKWITSDCVSLDKTDVESVDTIRRLVDLLLTYSDHFTNAFYNKIWCLYFDLRYIDLN